MKKTQEMLEGTHKRNGLSWRSTAEMYDIKATQVWKVDGDEFQTEEEANYARRMLENVYWVDSYERVVECHWACTGCDLCGSKGRGDSWF